MTFTETSLVASLIFLAPMKKQWLLFIAVCFLFLSTKAQEPTVTDGFVTFSYPSGAKSSEGTLRDGKPDGWWVSYSENGNKISEGNRKNFLLDSLWTFYDDNGEKMMTVWYQKGKKEGDQTIFKTDEYTVTHWESDTIIGLVRTFDKSGWLKSTVPYVDGKPHGLAKTYTADGLVVAITKYYHGVMSRTERINRTDNAGLKQGAWKYFWENGNLRLEGNYLNDKKHGFFKLYDIDGNFISVSKYDHDELVEDAKETRQLEKRTAYHSNGRPSIIATYYQDQPEGIRREFDTAGKIIKGYVFENGWVRYEGITDFNGQRQGLWKEYYPTGELRSKGKYKNSKPIGDWYFYFTDKSIEIEGTYNNKGNKQDQWVWYYPSGDTMIVANYEDDDLDGRYVEYDEAGQPLVVGTYIAGYEEGTWYYRNGTAVETGTYEGGKREGLWKSTFNGTQTSFEIRYEQDVRTGKYVAYWENGNIKAMGKYENGLQDGSWTYYNEDGILFLTTIFKDGKELKWNNYTIK